MDEFEKILAIVVLVATTFKAFTSGFKDIYDIKQGKKKKRRSPAKKNRRKYIGKEVSPFFFTKIITHPLICIYEKGA